MELHGRRNSSVQCRRARRLSAGVHLAAVDDVDILHHCICRLWRGEGHKAKAPGAPRLPVPHDHLQRRAARRARQAGGRRVVRGAPQSRRWTLGACCCSGLSPTRCCLWGGLPRAPGPLLRAVGLAHRSWSPCGASGSHRFNDGTILGEMIAELLCRQEGRQE